MNLDNLITIDEICVRYEVEHTFITALGESGLLQIVQVEQQQYISCNKISDFEKLRRLHCDLEINLEGLEAVLRLLEQVQELQEQNRELRNRLKLYE